MLRHLWMVSILLMQGDLIDAIDDPQEGWQFGENITTGKWVWIQCYDIKNMIISNSVRSTTPV